MMACDLCTVLDPQVQDGPLDRHLAPGQQRRLAANDHAIAVPTIGALVAGYVLVIPARHVLSLGQLNPEQLHGVERLAQHMADRITAIYGMSVLGFEYGLNQPEARRIDHGHLHLLPSTADLRGWLASRLDGYDIASMTELPATAQHSYITVRTYPGPLTVFPVPNDASPRIRLREVVAALDERLDTRAWDWQEFPCGQLIRQTVDDLTGPAASQRAGLAAVRGTR
jgi:diadenosine tetraphosphate (Ap4A) HIT family hydrolase